MATPASSGCRSIPESQLYLPSPCTSQVLKGSVMGANKRLSLPKITTENREYLSDRACYWKTDLGSYKQEKDIEAYLYFCPWAQRGWKAGGSHRLCAPPVWRCNRRPHTVPQPFLISRGWVGAGNDVWGESTSSVEVKIPASGRGRAGPWCRVSPHLLTCGTHCWEQRLWGMEENTGSPCSLNPNLPTGSLCVNITNETNVSLCYW